ncbi:metal iron transporter [Entomortierella parvispora]|uniref:Metal iron transporter n=1 Tax=Entomortierella parvispora TaxID=205924 RepID=A0A9P3LVE6_9FUNG|nr:metal iron transporter [Entomortierella parvispora]
MFGLNNNTAAGRTSSNSPTATLDDPRPLAQTQQVHAHDHLQQPRPTKFQTLMARTKRFMAFVGPGYIVSVGYMDPGNWATDLAGGSSFGYMLLFIILLSNLMAVVLQGLAVKLGVVSGLDLAQACRKFCPKYVNWGLYVLAELAIIACDLAEVIGSAIALNLLFKIPLPWGVVITALDVLIILFAFRDDQSVKSRRLFEALVILLVSSVGICFTAEIVYSQPVAKDVFKGFLPNIEILTNKEALYLAIGIIGATVMPHNLYLHSSIVKLRTSRELNKLASSQASMSSSSDLMTMEQREQMELADEDKGAISIKHSTIRRTLKYTFWDSTVALTFALYVNSAILIVSAATFKYKYPDQDTSGLADFFDAFHLLSQYLGKAAGYVFAIALLMAGQSSTLTATLAGQIIMEGFLGESYLKPWVRRLLTRCLAIIPALVIVIIKGQNGLADLLLASQVALSIQLPFAVIPLVIFTSMSRCMTIPVQDNSDEPGQLKYGFLSDGSKKSEAPASPTLPDTTILENNPLPVDTQPVDEEHRVESTNANSGAREPKVLLHNFANTWWLVGISVVISIVLLGLNFYLLVQSIQGS